MLVDVMPQTPLSSKTYLRLARGLGQRNPLSQDGGERPLEHCEPVLNFRGCFWDRTRFCTVKPWFPFVCICVCEQNAFERLIFKNYPSYTGVFTLWKSTGFTLLSEYFASQKKVKRFLKNRPKI